jgi:hypothetical protein
MNNGVTARAGVLKEQVESPCGRRDSPREVLGIVCHRFRLALKLCEVESMDIGRDGHFCDVQSSWRGVKRLVRSTTSSPVQSRNEPVTRAHGWTELGPSLKVTTVTALAASLPSATLLSEPKLGQVWRREKKKCIAPDGKTPDLATLAGLDTTAGITMAGGASITASDVGSTLVVAGRQYTVLGVSSALLEGL